MLLKICFLHIGRNAWQTREHVFNAKWPLSSSARSSKIVSLISRGNLMAGMCVGGNLTVRVTLCQGVPVGEIRDSNYLKIGHQIPSISHKFRLISSRHQRCINRHQSSLRRLAQIKVLIKDNVKRQNNLCMYYLRLLLPKSRIRSLRRMGVGWRFINQFFKFSVLPSVFLIRLI